MKVLFVMRSTIYVRNFESTLRLLAERGHEVHIVADPHPVAEANELVTRLCRDWPAITATPAPVASFDRWSFFGLELRRGLDYLRYLDAVYADAPKLRARAERNAPPFVLAALTRPLIASAGGRRLLALALRLADAVVPVSPDVDAFVRRSRADLLVVTPLVEPGAPQVEYVRAARAAGMPAVLAVYSWDNLTNKGLIHGPVDAVTVWNEAMKAEAVNLHHVRASRVIVTGAVPYDHWFGWRPRRSRAEFCVRVGLHAERPFVLYLCSSKFIAPNELAYIRGWIAAIRERSPLLRDCGVVIRPHPQNTEEWDGADLSDVPGVTVWPRRGGNPVDDESRTDYFDSIYYSACVVGVNTIAQVESAIVGRGSYTLLAPEFRDTQEGTLHFRHLQDQNGGPLHVAATLDEHVAQLEVAVRGDGDDEARCRRFVASFVRPFGIDQPAAPRLDAALEAVAARGVRSDAGQRRWARLVRPALNRAADAVARNERGRREKAARQEAAREQRDAVLVARRAAQRIEKERAAADAAAAARDEAARMEAVAHARAEVAALAYERYACVRRWASSLRRTTNESTLAPRERDIVAALAPLWEATRETIAEWRRFGSAISGVQPSAYTPSATDLRLRLKRELTLLSRQGGADLFVPEPDRLGGFGFARNGHLHNEDTVRFMRALVALQDGAVLGSFRGATSRRLVWEVGGGWGGFAYHFKSVFPNVTYLITGIPEVLLLSAVFVSALFPNARCRFVRADETGTAVWQDWDGIDFIFAPESLIDALTPPHIDLLIDLATFASMTVERVAAHAARAFAVGCPFVYSMLDADVMPGESPEAWRALARWYWPHPIPARREEGKAASAALAAALSAGSPHFVGWKRLRLP
jgi:hypothetical protein